jgi:hypothetical protein
LFGFSTPFKMAENQQSCTKITAGVSLHLTRHV